MLHAELRPAAARRSAGASRLPSGRDTDAIDRLGAQRLRRRGAARDRLRPRRVPVQLGAGRGDDRRRGRSQRRRNTAESNSARHGGDRAEPRRRVRPDRHARDRRRPRPRQHVQQLRRTAVVPCNTYAGSEPPGTDDHVYRFTPSENGTARVEVDSDRRGRITRSRNLRRAAAALAAADHHAVQLFDASLVTPDAGLELHGVQRGRRTSTGSAPTRARGQRRRPTATWLGGYLARIDDAAENTFLGDAAHGDPGVARRPGLPRRHLSRRRRPRASSTGATPTQATFLDGRRAPARRSPCASTAGAAASRATPPRTASPSTARARTVPLVGPATATDAYHYVCEDPTPPGPAPPRTWPAPT